MNYRNVISILLLLAVTAIAGEEVDSLRVASISVITTENHIYPRAPVGSSKLNYLQVNPTYQVYHYFPGAQLFGQTVESVDMGTRTVKMTDGETKVFLTDKTVRTNINVISLSTGETWWGAPGNMLTNGFTIIEPSITGEDITDAEYVASLPSGTICWRKSDNTNSIRLRITDLDENAGIIVETSKKERINIPKATAPELINLAKQKSQQAGAGYPPQSVGSPDP
jgi:hypothetical protein